VHPIYRIGTPLPSKYLILYISSTNIRTEFFKHAAHSVFFSSKCHLFHNATFSGSCVIRILHRWCAKIQMPNSSAKRLRDKIYVPTGCVLMIVLSVWKRQKMHWDVGVRCLMVSDVVSVCGWWPMSEYLLSTGWWQVVTFTYGAHYSWKVSDKCLSKCQSSFGCSEQ
jgi:hypothetical protein